MKTLNLTDEEYSFLLSSATPEQLNILKKENNNTNENNLISIKMLSIKEYKHYINDCDLSGSITKDNNNVWHHIKLDQQKFGMIAYIQSTPEQIYNVSKANNSVGVSDIYYNNSGQWVSTTYTYSFDKYNSTRIYGAYGSTNLRSDYICELFSNNKNNVFSIDIGNSEQIQIELIINSNYYYNDCLLDRETLTGEIDKTNHYKLFTLVAKNWGDHRVGHTCTWNTYFNCCFRPAFNYINNNKSVDIFK